MKNSFLSALLALGIGLMPGFGLNFVGASSVDWAHTDAAENSAKTAEMTDPETKSPPTAGHHAATVPNKVASADASSGQSIK